MRLLLGFCFAMWLSATVLDRIVVTVGPDVITETQVEEELAVTAFLNHAPITDDPQSRRAAAHRLIQQTLIARDMQLAHFPEPEPSQVDRAVNRLMEDYGNTSSFENALSGYGITAPLLRAHITHQLSTLRFIEYRFRPELTISDAELRAAYNRRTANWDTEHPGTPVPTFESSRSELRAALVETRTDEALDNWLNQTSSQERIAYLDPALGPAK
jgi:hypothetical protein